jgi:hypothetical protein
MIKRRLTSAVNAYHPFSQRRALLLKVLTHNIMILWQIQVFDRADLSPFPPFAVVNQLDLSPFPPPNQLDLSPFPPFPSSPLSSLLPFPHPTLVG